MQKAIQETSLGKKAKKELEEEFGRKKKELEKREADLKKMNDDYEKKALALTDEAKAHKQQEMQQEMLKYRELVSKSQGEIQKKQNDLTTPIIEGLRKVIGELAEKENYSVILEKSEQSVLWAKKEIDLTARVISEFEKNQTKSSPKKK
ncbi:MAG: OmpH family outer membrane protein [Bdellovibrionales bacterium]|nr:OmpH family outer membrane protein [Bdellovibrionales bacterium]